MNESDNATANDDIQINPASITILVVDDDELIRETFALILEQSGYKHFIAQDHASALQFARNESIDIAIIDLMLGEESGIEAMKSIKEVSPSIIPLIITGYGTIERAVDAMKHGAWDFIPKPFSPEILIEKLERIQEYALLRQEADFRRKVMNRQFEFSGVVGPSIAMQPVYEMILRAAASSLPVLIQGETGSGKEYIAEAIHLNSKRNAKPYVVMDCTSIPETLMEGTLFGSSKGAFTGAVDRKGLLESAHQGTLFLDEVGELNMEMQPKLLRCLETGQFRSVGSTRVINSDFRIIGATNRDLPAEIEEGNFRKDLYYRMSAIRIQVPPLRERPSDIPVLAKRFLSDIMKEQESRSVDFSQDALRFLSTYEWPGNIRQLRFVIESAFFQCTDDTIQPSHLQLDGHVIQEKDTGVPLPADPTTVDFKTYREQAILDAERAYIHALLDHHDGDVRNAADQAGLTREALYRVMSRCDVSASDYRKK